MSNERAHEPAPATERTSAEGGTAARAGGPEPYDFLIAMGSAPQIADALADLPDAERARLVHRLHEVRGNRFAHEVEAALMQRRDPMAPAAEGELDLVAAKAMVIVPDLARSRDVMQRLFRLSPHAMGVVLVALHRDGLLDNLMSPLPHGYAKALDARLPHGHHFGSVRSHLRPYFEDRDETDRSLTGLLGRIPYAGDPLAFAVDGLTFGFASEHDDAYRAKRRGVLTEDEYVDRSDAAGARAVAVATTSVAGGGVAGSYASGLTSGLSATGTAGRMTSAVATGLAGGAGGGFGAQLGSDVVSGELSDPTQYLHATAMGAGFGVAGGAIGGAAVETAALLPARTQAALARLAQRFPAHADIFDHYRLVGAEHAAHLQLTAARLHQLLADGAARLSHPELAAAVAGLPPDSLVSLTSRLDDNGLTIMHAEKLDADGGPGKVKTRGTPEDQLSAIGRNNPSPLTPDELARIESYQAERNAFLKTWRELDTSEFPQPTRDLLFGRADRAIRKNMTPDDVSAVIKERRGDVIRKHDGSAFDHIEEYRGARNAVVNALDAIDRRLELLAKQGAVPGEIEILSAKRRDFSNLLDRYEMISGGLP